MKRLSHILSLVALLCLCPPAQSQQKPSRRLISEANPSIPTDARVLFQAWRAIQRQYSREVQRISLTERLESHFDGAAGTWHSATDVHVSGYLNNQRWQSNVTSFQSDGEATPRNEWNSLTVQWRTLLGNRFAALIEDPALPLQVFDRMNAVGSAKEERIDGDLHWRIEMAPGDGSNPYEQVTLWVHQEMGRLSRSRAILSDRRSSLEVITDYTRIDGIDVPLKRRYEGKIQSSRRNRITTLFFQIDGDYTEYRLR